ncbi:3-methyladenine DNA glycosylase AlkD [Lachnotalea glycerini]|jgi:3-methyladenine DNA glycosylase AlkD|uniref:3-methyladenine DNA glycosylase AlkD n=2 Tax=Lachnotalea glycerini TaxID=1763509 RepID=A0A255ICN3_9FIRM|nr:3-methyladenine DNA glycosylase AlkD [Lachnotalea glycerini]RDY31042.1 DNA alkylation repair protein [Lachnotalea glycerini]
MNREIREQITKLAEPEYQEFSSKLLPGVSNILGVRLPNLRKIAKQIAKEDWRTYLKEASDASYEEIMLQGMVIGYINTNLDELIPYIIEFVPKIDNWSVCDSFCSSLKITKNDPERMWELLKTYLTDSREYFIRFGVVMLLNYFISEKYVKEALLALDSITSSAYYVQMGIAWAISMYYVKLPSQTMPYLENNHLDDFTYNKALQKITESLKVDQYTKSEIRSMKR